MADSTHLAPDCKRAPGAQVLALPAANQPPFPKPPRHRGRYTSPVIVPQARLIAMRNRRLEAQQTAADDEPRYSRPSRGGSSQLDCLEDLLRAAAHVINQLRQEG